MQYRKLGNTGAVVSAWCLGTMTFGNEADEATSFGILDDYVAAGGNFLDTANVYAGGRSEEIIGRWLKARPTEAKQVVIASKGRFPMGQGPNDLGLSRRHLGRALDASLRRLGVEQLDLYQMHTWDALTPIEETLRFLDDAVRSGKIAYYGFSNYLAWHLTKAALTAKMSGYTAPATLQPQYNLLARDIEHEIVPAALDFGIGLMPYSPLAAGWLSGKYQRDVTPGTDTRLGTSPKRGGYVERNASDRTWDILAVLDECAKQIDATMAQVALAWLMDRPAIMSVILGARTREQLRSNLSATTLKLPDEIVARLTEISSPNPPSYPYGTGGTNQRNRKLEGGR